MDGQPPCLLEVPCTLRKGNCNILAQAVPVLRRLPLVSTGGFTGPDPPSGPLDLARRTPTTSLSVFTVSAWAECTIAVFATPHHHHLGLRIQLSSLVFPLLVRSTFSVELSTITSATPFLLSAPSPPAQAPAPAPAPAPAHSIPTASPHTLLFLLSLSLSRLLSHSLLSRLVLSIIIIVCYRQNLRCRSP